MKYCSEAALQQARAGKKVEIRTSLFLCCRFGGVASQGYPTMGSSVTLPKVMSCTTGWLHYCTVVVGDSDCFRPIRMYCGPFDNNFLDCTQDRAKQLGFLQVNIHVW